MAATSAENGRAEASDLVCRFIRGDADAFTQIVALYTPRVAALAYRLQGFSGDLDDIVQDVFLVALENRRRFRAESALWTWLTSITLNRCRSHWRRQRVRHLGAKLLGRQMIAAASDQPAIADEIAAQVRKAVADLPMRDRELIVLHYFEQMSIADLCTVLGQRRVTVQVRLHRARQRLRDLLPNRMMEK